MTETYTPKQLEIMCAAADAKRGLDADQVLGKQIRDMRRAMDILICHRAEQRKKWMKAITKLRAPGVLSKRDVEILRKRFLQGYTFELVAEQFDVTRERIRQIESLAIAVIEAWAFTHEKYLSTNHPHPVEKPENKPVAEQ